MEINASQIGPAISRFLHRFHLMVFVVIILGALGAGIFTMYQIILATNDAQGYTAQTSNTTFDSDTSAKIKALNPSEYRLSPEDPQQPGASERALWRYGSVNPFIE